MLHPPYHEFHPWFGAVGALSWRFHTLMQYLASRQNINTQQSQGAVVAHRRAWTRQPTSMGKGTGLERASS